MTRAPKPPRSPPRLPVKLPSPNAPDLSARGAGTGGGLAPTAA